MAVDIRIPTKVQHRSHVALGLGVAPGLMGGVNP